jgi:hypothetical protein
MLSAATGPDQFVDSIEWVIRENRFQSFGIFNCELAAHLLLVEGRSALGGMFGCASNTRRETFRGCHRHPRQAHAAD